jgi:hypothetical protein
VKVVHVTKGVPMNMKLGVLGLHDGEREITIPRLYLKFPGRRDVEDATRSYILRPAKHCYRRSSQVQVFLPREVGDVDPRGVLLGVDTEKK